MSGLAALEAEVRRDLVRLNHPPANWPLGIPAADGTPVLDVLVVGGGMFGQTAGFALIRDGIRNIRVIDRARRGEEGPWGTYARMPTLRSPKHLTGPDLGIPSLTFRAWWEAQHGAEGWERLYKIHRLDWLAYLLWVRDAAARATGRVFHSVDPVVDFGRFRGRRIAVLGANASAFDNAGTALEAGVAKVTMFTRRAFLPQVNKTRGMVFSGFLRGFGRLDDATRWRFLTYTAGEASPPPHESVLRCERHPGFRLVFNARWRDVAADAEGVTVTTAEGPQRFDAVIFGTGFTVDPTRMPELAAFRDAMQLWGDRVAPEEAARYPELARAPYLGEGFELTPRDPASLLAGALARLRLLGPAAASSHGILSGDIPAVGTGCTTLAREIGQALFAEEVGRHYDAVVAFEEPELAPTPYFVPPEQRLRRG
ncbi:hypothetical protein ROTAS13_01945 [Roseomonas sp. TAS13]|uniref:FAD/NAD(P)-binding protein n=1 Tax=Roseomonas sp. TAS13 TaxID=1926319 RepID=UPI0009606315|nr:FAD/NAD(P)-binding protein [Roseomonas sp. TAS13]USQ73397.1 FAD/NAD(P)-binding protein [Roseomonas mucosa]GAV34280.1 hypothetical protein ROTAS13_01945 [Roseomonas sp. TAS13]